MRMCFIASLLPTPREPECRNSHIRSASSTLTSMKWLPEPRLPSCSRQFGLIASACSRPSSASSSAIRTSEVSESELLYLPALRGTAAEIEACRSSRSDGRSASTYWVRIAIMPQPMSTPTAAGMIAPRVGITEPTVAPLPRCASGMNARCGKMNGIVLVASACARVPSSRIDAQFMSRLLICSSRSSCSACRIEFSQAQQAERAADELTI
jgi:hypothetical protein